MHEKKNVWRTGEEGCGDRMERRKQKVTRGGGEEDEGVYRNEEEVEGREKMWKSGEKGEGEKKAKDNEGKRKERG